MFKIFILILLILLVVYHKGFAEITNFFTSGIASTIKFLQGRE
jgi:hypothetical protein